jgi:hypothetical protein
MTPDVASLNIIAELTLGKLSDHQLLDKVDVTIDQPNTSSPNPSMSIWIENHTYIARISIWIRRTGEVGVIRVNDSTTIFDYSFNYEAVADVVPYIHQVVNVFLE